MSGILDHSLVGFVLAASAGYAILALGPRTLRPRVYAALSRLLGRAPHWLGLGRVAQGFAIAAHGKAAGACGGCDTCGSEPAADAKSITSGPLNSPAPEVRIPVAKIGKRA
jgi:hypothetical protein